LIACAASVLFTACGGDGDHPSTPSITGEPNALTVNAGQPASFSVSASGTGPLFYQWRRGDVDIPGATAATYAIAIVTASDDGALFRVAVKNTIGSVTSDIARLTVHFAPDIISHPVGLAVATGARATFSLVTTGNPVPSLQWRRNGVAIAGATEASFTTAATSLTDNGAVFSVVASNAAGTATSSGALLEVLDPPVITRNPVSIAVTAPAPAPFSVTATGSPILVFRWTFNGQPLSGATSSAIVFSPSAVSENGAVLTAIVTNRVGSATSAPAVLTVH
jgi:hypothetical protein